MKRKIEYSFKHHLNEALHKKFKKKLTASFLALQFNLLVEDDLSISRETARKWLNGQALPEINRLKILLNWLEIDANGFLRLATLQTHSDRVTQAYLLKLNDLVRDLDGDGKKLVIYTAWTLQKKPRGNTISFEEFYSTFNNV